MATHALDPAYERISVEEFLDMDFGDARTELEDGVIYMMAGGSEQHARISGNIFAFLRVRLRGTGCRPYNSDFALQTADFTARMPDVSIYCGNPSAPENARKKLLGDPRVVFEVLSPSTAMKDQRVKLEEYKALAGTTEIVLVDPDAERVRRVHWTPDGVWHDGWLPEGSDLHLPSLDLTIPHDEIFARD
ncbi:Uma2 family endonuclease [Sphingomonas adhaesiva]|uniref:Uma2 family endonuclease n=1 Tax=Sphingomonas adhaesiva TaxID=28212 RepID=UPI002FF80B8C